jgi:hypothetical protein
MKLDKQRNLIKSIGTFAAIFAGISLISIALVKSDFSDAVQKSVSIDIYPVSWISELELRLAETNLAVPSELPRIQKPSREKRTSKKVLIQKNETINDFVQSSVSSPAPKIEIEFEADDNELVAMRSVYNQLRKGFVVALQDKPVARVLAQAKITDSDMSTQLASANVESKPEVQVASVPKALRTKERPKKSTRIVVSHEWKSQKVIEEGLGRLRADIQIPIIVEPLVDARNTTDQNQPLTADDSNRIVEVIRSAQSAVAATPPEAEKIQVNYKDREIDHEGAQDAIHVAHEETGQTSDEMSAPVVKTESSVVMQEQSVLSIQAGIQTNTQSQAGDGAPTVKSSAASKVIIEPGLFAQARRTLDKSEFSEGSSYRIQKNPVLIAELNAEFSRVASNREQTKSSEKTASSSDALPEPAPKSTQLAQNDAKSDGSSEERTEVETLKEAQPVVKVSKVKSFIEAFSKDEKISNVQESVFSHEGIKGRANSVWLKLKREGYLETLTLSGSRGPFELPLISNNSSQLLYAIAGLKRRESAGIIFGKVARGWEVQTSGNAEKVIYFSQTQKILSASELAEERDFILLNAQPGVHLISALEVETGRTGAIAAPCIKGEATYVDFSEPRFATIQGNAFDATSGQQLRPLKGIKVEIVGQESKFTSTDSTGRFQLNQTTLFSSYPLTIDYEKKDGFRHRIQYSAIDSFSVAQLFVFSSAQVDDLVGQLAGGVSPESGLVMGALPQLGLELEKNKLYPEIKSLESEPLLQPETYVLGHDGQLLVKEPLLEGNPRFTMLQAPEGLAKVDVKTSQNEVVWSQLIVNSPGVIHLIGN